MEKKPILYIDNLEIIFSQQKKERKILDSISFFLNEEETLGIVGESGSGKTMTALSLMNLLPPGMKISGGTFKYSGVDTENLFDLKEKQWQHVRGKEIGIVFQEPLSSLNPTLTCGFQVLEVLQWHETLTLKQAKTKTLELFHEVQLPDPQVIYGKYPHQLSGGQRQRVMIAMAIACNPPILIADEPTTALDVTVQAKILELLSRLREKYRMSTIFISHDLGIIKKVADRVLIMRNGKILESGDTQSVMQDPEHHYTRGLIACRPKVDNTQYPLPTVEDYISGNTLERKGLPEKKKPNYSEKPILEVKNVSVAFPQKRNLFGKPSKYIYAVNQVNFTLYRGETLGLVGESGSGKTTIGRTLMLLISGYGGEIQYQGTPLDISNRKELMKYRKNVQIIFQDPYSSLNPRHTVGEILTEPMNVHKIVKTRTEREKQALELLSNVGLPEEYFDRYPHELSGGQRQRLGIARALAVRPEFMILDESVSALDVSIQAQVLNLLNRLKHMYNLTYIFISHDLAVVKYMSDRMIVLKDGKIMEEGLAEKIFLHPEHPYTKELIFSVME